MGTGELVLHLEPSGGGVLRMFLNNLRLTLRRGFRFRDRSLRPRFLFSTWHSISSKAGDDLHKPEFSIVSGRLSTEYRSIEQLALLIND